MKTVKPPLPRYEFEYSKHPDPMNVVLALLDGVDISLVDPQLYSSLLGPLDQCQQKYERSKEESVVKRIDWFINYIKTYPERKMLSDTLCRAPRRKKSPAPPFNQEQLDFEVERVLISTDNLNYTVPEYEQLIYELRQRKGKLTEEQNFQKADIYKQRIRELLQQQEQTQASQFSTNRANNIRERVNDAERSLTDVQRRWDKVVQNFNIDKEKQIQEFTANQMRELEEFQKSIEENYPKTLPKKTNTHLQLQRQEEVYVAAKKFQEAEFARNKLAQYREKEKEELVYQWENENRMKIRNFKEKQRMMLKVKLEYLKSQEVNLHKAKDSEITAACRKVEALKRYLSAAEFSESMSSRSKPSLPNLKTARQLDMSEIRFRQKALMNMKVYTRRPPNSARGGKRNKISYL